MECTYLSEGKCLRGLPIHCDGCPERLTIEDKDFSKKWQDPLIVIGRDRAPASDVLRNMLAGSSAFLVGGGPSANDLPLEQLNRRGVWSLCVNNVAGHSRFRPQAFVCSDPPKKFSHSIWLDPGIMKFVPIPKLGGRRNRLRFKIDGQFVEQKQVTTENSPNVWGFQRHNWLWPDDRFFATDGACWGNHQAGVNKTGQPKTVCTMLLALRILRYLGASRIFLVGVDFTMTPDRGYSFGQRRDEGACQSNNSQFVVVNEWLCKMQQAGVFKRFGVEVFNCYERSGLRAFPHVPFADAVRCCRGIVEDTPDLAGWYDPEPKKEA
jgi:hypothetical protein